MKRLQIVVGTLLFATSASAQLSEEFERGLSATSPYGIENVEAINLFNGAVNLRIPIGQTYPVNGALSYGLTLHYGSNVWEFEAIDGDIESTPLSDLSIAGHQMAGLGWQISIPQILHPDTPPLNPDEDHYMLLEGDGTRRLFYDTLHEGETENPGVMYTRDSSYLRFTNDEGPPQTFLVESPDGLMRTFAEDGTLTKVEDRFGNAVDYDHSVADQITITDDHGRVHRIYFRTVAPAIGMVDRIELQAFGGATATYTFTYQDATVERWRDSYHPPSSTVVVPLLTSVEFPDGSSYDMTYATTPIPENGDLDVPGQIDTLKLPTGGKYEYFFLDWKHKNAAWLPNAEFVPGIVKKKLIDSSDVEIGEWEYAHVRTLVSDLGRTWVYFPEGGYALHAFHDNNAQLPHGTPGTYVAPYGGGDPDLLLTTEWYDEGDVLLRDHYTTYEWDSVFTGGNSRLQRARTRYKDDGNRTVTTTHELFDGLGHYRKTTVDGSWGNDGPGREIQTSYNSSVGTWGTNFTMLSPSDPWVLNTFDIQRTGENGVNAFTKFCFDSSTGFLERTRVMSGSSVADTDLVTQYTSDAVGNTVREELFGGDVETGSLPESCATPFTGPQYRTDHTYAFGVLATSEVKDTGGASVGFLSVDRDIDLSTGLTVSSRDTSGLQSDFDYDLLGRPVEVEPPGRDSTYLTYTPAGGGAELRVQSTTGTAEQWVHFDDWGRLWKERVRRPGGSFSARETLYDVQGRTASVSEWTADGGSFANKTQYLEYDVFDRPGRIRPPDGAQHDVTIDYAGGRLVERTSQVATGRNGSALVYTASTYKHRSDACQGSPKFPPLRSANSPPLGSPSPTWVIVRAQDATAP